MIAAGQSLPTPTSRVVMVDIFDAPLFVVVVIVDSVVIMAYRHFCSVRVGQQLFLAKTLIKTLSV
jgi:hypothetical protein